jgi:peptide/nickel transport system permease protein
VLLGHMLPNAAAVIVTVVALTYANLLEGAVLIETVFAWPGLGRYLTTALFAADTPAVLGGTLLIGVCFVLINGLTDVLVKLVDPRTR